MPPKKTESATKAAPKKPAEHPPYLAMIKEAIAQLKERNGSSRQALKKYCKSNFKGLKDDSFDRLFNSALAKGVKAGELIQPKGPSGPVKLQKKDAAKSTSKPAKAAGEKKKAAPKKASTTKKTATTTKAAKPKKEAAKPKKEAAKPKKDASTTKTKKSDTKKAADKPLSKVKASKVTKKTAAPKKDAKKATTPKKAKKADAPAAEAS